MTTGAASERSSPDAAADNTADAAGPEIVAILDAIDVPIVVVGRDCRLVRINRAANKAFAFAPTDIGRHLGTIGALAAVKDIDALCAQVIADDTPERRDVRSGDRRFLLRVAPYAIDTRATKGAVLTFTNVTAFRASLEQAIYEREYTKAILNTVTSPLVILNAELRVQSGNRAFYSMFGVSREKAQNVPLQSLGDDAWRACDLWAALDAVVTGSREFQPLEVEREFEATGRQTLLLEAHRVAHDGAATILLAVQDITERKRTEEELKTAGRRKDEFLAVLAHELRNPLAPIRTGLQLIRLSGDTPESVRRVRTIMERQVAQMVRLIDDLLDVSRISSGKIVLQRKPTSLIELIQTAVEEQRAALESSKTEFTLDLPPQDCSVDVDATRFVQILSNVLHNAAKFTPPRGRIHCSVEILATLDSPRVAIRVSDTGDGISKDMLQHLFAMFTQAQPATERSHGGLGIGLALSQQLARMHGGDIVAHSDGPGHGSTFTITVPVSTTLATRAPLRQLDVPRLASRVLIIDDNRDAAQTLAMLVEQLGGSPCIAHDTATGLQTVQENPPDVVFLDIGMPGIDGYEACRRLRQWPSPKPILIIAVTGWGQSQDKQRALDAGFDAHLTKPADLESLAHVLATSANSAP
jgi:two-component system, chemotaxis family, CheB/CheR fusion protein